LGFSAAEVAVLGGRLAVGRLAGRRGGVPAVLGELESTTAGVGHHESPPPRVGDGVEHTGVTGWADYVEPPTTPIPAPRIDYHPTWNVPVVPKERLQLRLQLAKIEMEEALADARRTLRSYPKGPARNRQMLGALKKVRNTQETLGAILDQMRFPKDAVATNARFQGVLVKGRLHKPHEIPGMTSGRIDDWLLLKEDGRVFGREVKSTRAVLESFRKSGGVIQTSLKKGVAQAEFANMEAAKTFAQQMGGTLEWETIALNGQTVPVSAHPDMFQQSFGDYAGGFGD
jgi:hypothetical protein